MNVKRSVTRVLWKAKSIGVYGSVEDVVALTSKGGCLTPDVAIVKSYLRKFVGGLPSTTKYRVTYKLDEAGRYVVDALLYARPHIRKRFGRPSHGVCFLPHERHGKRVSRIATAL